MQTRENCPRRAEFERKEPSPCAELNVPSLCGDSQTVALGEKMCTLAPIGVFLKIQIAWLSLPMFTHP